MAISAVDDPVPRVAGVGAGVSATGVAFFADNAISLAVLGFEVDAFGHWSVLRFGSGYQASRHLFIGPPQAGHRCLAALPLRT